MEEVDKDIENILKQKAEERIWQMWLSQYPNMDKDTFISYNDFLRDSGLFEDKSKRRRKTTEELRSMAQELKERR